MPAADASGAGAAFVAAGRRDGDAKPLDPRELSVLFAPLNEARAVALAVSGGADSLALLAGFARWRAERAGPEPTVLTVDHQLRAGSADDAAMVVGAAQALGFAARILTIDQPPSRNIETAAREARYRLLIGAAKQAGCSHLLVAHHLEDQAETFLMRLKRGAGVFGLAAMRPQVVSSGIVVFRPFLKVPRSRLRATALQAGLTPSEDPTNADLRFERARLRAEWPKLVSIGIDAGRLAEAAGRFAARADAIDAGVDRLLADVAVTDLAVIAIPADLLRRAGPDIRLRLLSRAVMAVAAQPYPPRTATLAALEQDLRETTARIKRTIAGAVVQRRQGSILVYREFGRNGLERRPLEAGRTIHWDGRFTVATEAPFPPGLDIAPLGETGRHLLKARPADVPAAALDTLPAVWDGDRLVCVPSLPDISKCPSDMRIRVTQTVSEQLRNPPRFPSFDPD